jgi:hypothetical protein
VDIEAERRDVLIELAHEHLELRLAAGEAAWVESYLQRYPKLGSDPAACMRWPKRRERWWFE